VSPSVRDEVRARFTDQDAVDVERLLGAIDLSLNEPAQRRERDRVHLGILLLAGGSFERFARVLALAATDWRDVLVAAGLANDNWPEVLRAAGFRVP
jgi:hypothetical protein